MAERVSPAYEAAKEKVGPSVKAARKNAGPVVQSAYESVKEKAAPVGAHGRPYRLTVTAPPLGVVAFKRKG